MSETIHLENSRSIQGGVFMIILLADMVDLMTNNRARRIIQAARVSHKTYYRSETLKCLHSLLF